MTKTDHKKLLQAFRYWILGRAESNPDYFRVLKAIELAKKYHKGSRKDGAPEFSHQVTIVTYLMTLHSFFSNPVAVFIVALLHDTYEDYPESEAEIRMLFPDEWAMIYRISKVRGGKKIPYEQYFGEMQECEVCSIVKLADRIANISTMVGVFSIEKQDSYIKDLEDWFFPMLKFAKRMFPEQTAAYENMKCMLYVMKDTILKVREDISPTAVVA